MKKNRSSVYSPGIAHASKMQHTQYFEPEDWTVTEASYQPALNQFMESIFFLGNGYMGVRATPEEGFSSTPTFPATYVGAVYDEVEQNGDPLTRGYVNRLTFMTESPNWFPLDLVLGGVRFDPLQGRVSEYRRRLDMRTGTVTRSLVWQDTRRRRTRLEFTRFVSMADRHLGAIRARITPLNWNGRIVATGSIDGRACQRLRQAAAGAVGNDGARLLTETLATRVQCAMAFRLLTCAEDGPAAAPSAPALADRHVSRAVRFAGRAGRTCTVDKLVAVTHSRDKARGPTLARATTSVNAAAALGFDRLQAAHAKVWAAIWADNDVHIDGDLNAQQAIRFCVFNMHQSYSGYDPLVNFPAKGLSGPGYGGLIWWDSEAYLGPFFAYTAPHKSRALLRYRYLTLAGARAKARAFMYEGAMFPWVTVDGREVSGDWQYGMLEQHPTTTVNWAVRHYVQVTGDEDYLWRYGAEVVIETARFWASRANWHEGREAYVINFVTGPDEYTVAVNNNCYTNFMAKGCLEYAGEVAGRLAREQPARWRALRKKLRLGAAEPARWAEVAAKMYIPYAKTLGIHEQDDSFLGRDPFNIHTLDKRLQPISRHWNWNKLMRSQAIKQADVVALLFLHNDRFDAATKRRDYDYYEPRTTHDSSLSPCMYSIMAAEVGREEDAFRYYLRSARLDLDDVNSNADIGLHTACLAGSWMSVVNGFGGMRVRGERLCFDPHVPRRWKAIAFTILFRGRKVRVRADARTLTLAIEGAPLPVWVGGRRHALRAGQPRTLAL